MTARKVDLRSDTVTKPTPAMRRAMAAADVGDDVYGEDPTVNELQRHVARLLGKEAALFVPSGTMGNLSAVMSHCWTRGQEVLLGDQSHIFMYEQGGISQLGGVTASTLRNNEDGSFCLDELRRKMRPASPEIHETHTALVCLENSHNRCGGRVLPLSFIREVCALARSRGVPVHMDGARLLNAAVAYGVPAHEVVKDCASVSMCLSKGVGAPVGSVVAGSRDFITRAHRVRKVLGGAMRQAGVLAAAALHALETAEDRLREDHRRAKRLAEDISALQSDLVTVDPALVESNMLLLRFPSPLLTSTVFVARMAEARPSDAASVRCGAWCDNRVRLVLHSDLEEDDLALVLDKIRIVTL